MKKQNSTLLLAGVVVGAIGVIGIKKIIDKAGIAEKVTKKLDRLRFSEEDFDYIYDDSKEESMFTVRHGGIRSGEKVKSECHHNYKLEPLEEETRESLPEFLKHKNT